MIETKATSSLPLFNADTLARIETMLPQTVVLAHLRALAGQAATLAQLLETSGALQDPSLPGAAHALAGSAGLYGFERLFAALRDFEASISAGSAQARAAIVYAVLEASREEMSRRMDAISAQ